MQPKTGKAGIGLASDVAGNVFLKFIIVGSLTKGVNMTAEERGMELLQMKMTDLPPLALEYAKYLCSKVGGCGEVFITAYAHYAQAVESLESKDSLYTIDTDGMLWFEEHSPKNNIEPKTHPATPAGFNR